MYNTMKWMTLMTFQYHCYLDLQKFSFKKYMFTMNHKRIAMNYTLFCFLSAMSGGMLASMISIELSTPGSFFFKNDSMSYLQVMSAHGLIMIFFVVVPLVFGSIANYFMPYHVGSKDVAFPSLNSLGFWLLPSGYILLAKPAFMSPMFLTHYDMPSFFYKLTKNNTLMFKYENKLFMWDFMKKTLNENYSKFSIKNMILPNFFSNSNVFWYLTVDKNLWKNKKKYMSKCSNAKLTMAGWTFMTPFSSNMRFTGLGSQDIAMMSVMLSGVSTTISFTNLLITSRTLSAPGLRNSSILLPFMSITLFLVMSMLALITPVLGAAMIMLLLDRHWKTTFFDYAYGGDVILFNHLFWFFGHPEVYVVIMPAFGLINMLLPFYNTSRIASKHHLVWATYIMGYMGFLVWGHHMYLVGLDHSSRSLYSSVTVMISLPAIVKLVNWTLTMLNGTLKMDTAVFFVISFFFFFLCGGLTGMWLSHVGLNMYVHDTFYVVAHFHFMFSASTFSAIFAAMYYYFSTLFSMKFSKIFSFFHLIYWFSGQWITFLPLFWVGYNGLPRSYHDYPVFFMAWHGLSSAGHYLTMMSMVFFFLMLTDSFLEKKIYIHNTLGIVRFNKSINYYIFKIKYNQHNQMFNNNNMNFKQLNQLTINKNYEYYK